MTLTPDKTTPEERQRLADATGYSKRTVDRAIDDPELVSDEARRRVDRKRDELGLGKPPDAIFGLLVPDALNPFFAQLAKSIATQLAHSNYHLLTASSNGHETRALAAIQFWLSQKVSGVFYAQNPVFRETIGLLSRAAQVSVVFVDVDPNQKELAIELHDLKNNVGTVLADNAVGIRRAMAHLVKENGHERVAFLAGPDTASTAAARESAFEAAHVEFGLTSEPVVLRGDYSYESGRNAAIELSNRYLTSNDTAPTAIIVSNDLMAIGLINGLRKMGVRIPDQLSVVGFDNIEGCEWPTPELTSIDQRVDAIAEQAVRRMTERFLFGSADFESAATPRGPDMIPPRLVERKSVRLVSSTA